VKKTERSRDCCGFLFFFFFLFWIEREEWVSAACAADAAMGSGARAGACARGLGAGAMLRADALERGVERSWVRGWEL